MRKFIIPLLLASAVASPAVAAPRHGFNQHQQTSDDAQSARDDSQSARDERQTVREERQSAREERSQARTEARSDRSDNRASLTPQQQAQPQQQQVVQPSQLNNADRAQRQAAANAMRDARRSSLDAARTERIEQRQQVIEQRQQDMRDTRELRQSNRPIPAVINRPPPVVSDVPRPGTQPPLRTDHRGGGNHHWDGNWRHDHRYDWHNYRNHHHSLFHLGLYYDPYGWGYSPFQIGWRLWPNYYSSNFWINDPWMYRLPYAPPGYVWVRYWNDAVLVDMWSGTVVDMIPGFFW